MFQAFTKVSEKPAALDVSVEYGCRTYRRNVCNYPRCLVIKKTAIYNFPSTVIFKLTYKLKVNI
jgi:hypothetical protein